MSGPSGGHDVPGVPDGPEESSGGSGGIVGSCGIELSALFDALKPVVGMVHLLPLPGAPRWGGSMEAVRERALVEAEILVGGGVDGLLVENYGDVPFHPGPVPAETVAAMAAVVGDVVRAHEVPVGVNVLRNDARSALGVAAATGASFIRVNVHTGVMWTDQGVVEGRAHETLRVRAALGARVAILADVWVKHATPPPGSGPEEAARDARQRGLADGLLVTGPATGSPAEPDRVRRVREAVPDTPVWIASGVDAVSGAALLDAADGAIVGSAFHRDGVAGRGVDRERVRAVMEALGRPG